MCEQSQQIMESTRLELEASHGIGQVLCGVKVMSVSRRSAYKTGLPVLCIRGTLRIMTPPRAERSLIVLQMVAV